MSGKRLLAAGGLLSRRGLLRYAGAAAAGTLAGPVARVLGAPGARPPNIIFILADDLGWHQLGCFGSAFYETPRIDQLAAEGMRFRAAYAAAPVCSPTRASIMTGKYPARLHLTCNIPGLAPTDRKLLTPDWQKYLPVEEVTVAELLRQAGYATGHFGKWHLNRDRRYRPGRPGDPGSQGFDEVLTTAKPRYGQDNQTGEDWHNVGKITDAALAFIEKNRHRPFFCHVSHNAIHLPEIESDELVRKYEAKAGADHPGNRPKQAAMLETLDRSVGRIVDRLEEMGIGQNTVVIFFSDNGHWGSKEAGPLRGSKGDLYEGGIREPLIVRWPQVVPEGATCDTPVISNDFLATFCDLAGVSLGNHLTDGISLMPLLAQSDLVGRDTLYWHFPHYHGSGLAPCGAIREGRYKLIEWFEQSVSGEEGALELYDIQADPTESKNLAQAMPDRTHRLHRELREWRRSVGAQEMTRNPAFGG
jgi:arylsulfatase A-like enzyme